MAENVATNLKKPGPSNEFRKQEEGNGIQSEPNGIQMRQPLFIGYDILYLWTPYPQPLRGVSPTFSKNK